MLTCKTQFFLFHVEGHRLLNGILASFDVTDGTLLLQLGEWILNCFDVVFLQLGFDDGVIIPIDESVFWCLVLYNTHLRINIVLHAVVVSVQVIGRYVQQDGNVGTEIVHIVELK